MEKTIKSIHLGNLGLYLVLFSIFYFLGPIAFAQHFDENQSLSTTENAGPAPSISESVE